MDAIVPYAIWAALILAGLGILSIILFSLRGLFYGKVEPLTVGLMVVPVAVFVILGLIMPTWVMAGIWTTLVLAGLAILALFLSGLRSFFI